MKAETDMALDKQRTKPLQPGKFDPFDPLSQMGKPLTHDQVLKVIQKFIPGAIAKPSYNPYLKRKLVGLYIPNRSKAQVKDFLSALEIKKDLRFVCACEEGMMPEWDILQRDEKGLPTGLVRGWRSVFGIFYRDGLMPHIADDGQRRSSWEIRESKKKETTF
jgi:hypothetical protein